ncbi:peptidoglycan-binding domain-containing protein [Streptomyces sp. NPDC008163]|uniref:peptidoglycan-binding domain-containing protein n=1 Tax=Streptomyces sp. NPDC008163 TaxID=3364818 RepID=UPI0036E30552
MTAGAVVLGLAGSASAAPGVASIGYGRSTAGDQVWCVQHSINYYVTHHRDMISTLPPYTPEQFHEDSQWGPITEAMVKWYQGDLGLPVDGIVSSWTGYNLIIDGDWYYNNNTPGQEGYCYWRLPSF